jgi:PAS domain S-box-containing protein
MLHKKQHPQLEKKKNMSKRYYPCALRINLITLTAIIGLWLSSDTAWAQGNSSISNIALIEMSTSSYLIIGFLLLLSILMFFVFQRRFLETNQELEVVSAELNSTFLRIEETKKNLEKAQAELKEANNRQQSILSSGHVGIFQTTPSGKCIFVNRALQEMSGLYPKKALKDGLNSAIHPEDRERFKKAWSAFVDDNKSFQLSFRFQQPQQPTVHVACQATKIYNSKRELEGYVGWIIDTTNHHEETRDLLADRKHYLHFIEEATDGYYQLIPETPIPLGPPKQMAEVIMENMMVGSCNSTFAALYGTEPIELRGKVISAFQNGCGPFKDIESITEFIKTGFKTTDHETTQQNKSGSRIHLLHSAIGIVEDDKLVEIRGLQHDISRQKNEMARVVNKVEFMDRILGALPADIQVKDSRCRYLYVNQSLSKRTGIPQKKWLGKTKSELFPSTPAGDDQSTINTMKSGKPHRTETLHKNQGKPEWTESIQIPLVSEGGLVEGVVDLTLEISDRKNREEQVRQSLSETEKQLKKTQQDLHNFKAEHSKTLDSLSEAIQKLKSLETEKAKCEHDYQKDLATRKRVEESLRNNEEKLIKHQRELEEELANRLDKLNKEADKQRNWEGLLAIKEKELRKAEQHSEELRKQIEKQTALRKQLETHLETNRSALDKYSKELDEISSDRKQQLEAQQATYTQQLKDEQLERENAENKLKKTEELLQKAQQQLKQTEEKHAGELQHETAERKEAARNLTKVTEELDKFQQQFSQRLEEETKIIKLELSQKQIRERTMRQHENNLERRIRELEKSLELKTKEQAKQLQEKEKLETECKQIADELGRMNMQNKELVNQETQEQLQKLTKKHAEELERKEAEHKKTVKKLTQSMEELNKLKQQFTQRIEEQTRVIKLELSQTQIHEKTLQQHEQNLERRIKELEKSLQRKNQELTEQVEDHENLADKVKLMGQQQKELIERETQKLNLEIAEIRLKELRQNKQIETLQREKQASEKDLDKRNRELAQAQEDHQLAKTALAEAQQKLQKASDGKKQSTVDETNALHKQLTELQKTGDDLRKQLTELQQEKQTADRNLKKQKEELIKAKKDHQATSSALSEAQQKLQQASGSTHQTSEELDALQKQLTELQKEKQATEKDLNKRNRELAKAQEDHQVAKSALAGLQKAPDGNKQPTADEINALHKQLTELQKTGDELRKQLADLQQEKQDAETTLATAQKKLQQAPDDTRQSSEEMDALQKQLMEQQKAQDSLQKQLVELQEEKQAVDKTLELRIDEFATLSEEYKKQARAYRESETKLKKLNDTHNKQVAKETAELQRDMIILQQREIGLREQEKLQKNRIAELEAFVTELSGKLKGEEQI